MPPVSTSPFRPSLVLWLAALLVTMGGLVPITSASHTTERATIDLDGTWHFATDPDGVGEDQEWFRPERTLPVMSRPGYADRADGTIRVPGSWDSQGYGEPTEYRFHQFTGRGWYRKTVRIPADWAGRSVFLQIGGVQRSARIWVNGQFVAEHIGYLSALEFDISNLTRPGGEATLTIMVDSRQDEDADPFNGTTTGIEMPGAEWGGIWGHVALEARGDLYLQDVLVQTAAIADPLVSVTGTLGGTAQDEAQRARVTVRDAGGRSVATGEVEIAPFMREQGVFNLKLPMPGAALWSPEHPALYTARVELMGGDAVRDVYIQRFGLRQFLIDGAHFLLNGRRIFLASAGDDNVYPNDFGALYVGKDDLVARLRLMKSYGFNGVRTHSSVMSPDFYDACDEVGLLARPEMPFSGTHKVIGRMRNSGRGYETTVSEFTNAVIRLRNHPSIYAWSGGNELFSYSRAHRFPHGNQMANLMLDLQAVVNRYHPGAYFVDNLNTYTARPQILDHARDLQRGTVDFISPNSHQAGDPYGTRGLEVSPPLQPKPVIIHEAFDRATFPNLASRSRFTRDIVPYWLNEMSAYYERLGLLDETPLWERVSQALVLDNVKLEAEAIRLQNEHVGYDYWLFQDFWETSNGLVDYLLTPKPGIPADRFRNFNSDMILLQRGLDVTHRAGETLALEYLISNYGSADVTGARMALVVSLGDDVILRTELPVVAAGQGELTSLGVTHLTLPDVDEPADLTIQVRLPTGERLLENDWTARVYPRRRAVVDPGMPVFTPLSWVDAFSTYGARSIPAGAKLPSRAIYVVNHLDDRLIEALEQGATVVLIQPENELLPVHRTYGWRAVFWSVKPHRMLRSVGHLVYDHELTRCITEKDGLQHEWYHLLENATPFMLDDLPTQPDVLMRAIEGSFSMASKALMFEAKVGRGVLLASGLNHLATPERPENQWVMDQMIQYVAGAPQPAAEISADWLRQRLSEIAAAEPDERNR